MRKNNHFEYKLNMEFGNDCTAQHSTAQHSTAQHSTAQHSTAQHSTAQHSTAKHSTAQHSTAQHSTANASPVISPLFRPEVTAALGSQWMGAIRLAQPISAWLIAGVALLVAAALIAFLSVCQ